MAVAVSLVVSGAMLYAQGSESHRSAEKPTATPTAVASAPAPTSAPPSASVPPGGPFTATATQAQLLAASAPVAAPDFQFELSPGIAPEGGLQVHTIWVARAISVMFPEIETI